MARAAELGVQVRSRGTPTAHPKDLDGDVILAAHVQLFASRHHASVVVDLMLRLGYGGADEDAGQALGKSGDEVVDGVIKQDRLGLDNIDLQAKRWDSNKVGRKDIQAFVGALSGKGASKGVFITTSEFSREARDYANSLQTPRLSLIDGLDLARLMIMAPRSSIGPTPAHPHHRNTRHKSA
jgi:restriction endonuclease Mrr